MMEYNVAQLLKSPLGTTREFEFTSESLQIDESTRADMPAGYVRLDRIDEGILVRGEIPAQIHLPCARCLEPATVDVVADIAEEFVPVIDVSTGRDLDTPDDDLAFQIDEHHCIDLREAMRQNILASIPIQVLCKDDCKGLCPVCGINKNEQSCACIIPESAHPLAALAHLVVGDVAEIDVNQLN